MISNNLCVTLNESGYFFTKQKTFLLIERFLKNGLKKVTEPNTGGEMQRVKYIPPHTVKGKWILAVKAHSVIIIGER